MEVIKEAKVKIDDLEDLLREGKILTLPTDTVYGLVCNASNKEAVERVFEIKGRDIKKPISVFVRDIKMAESLAEISKEQEEFLKTAWPGKVTVVLKRKRGRKLFGIDKETIALRIPDHKLIKNLFKLIDFPLSGTSANLSGEDSAIETKELLKQFKTKGPDLIVDGGKLKERKPSVIFDLTKNPIRILRQ
ncbi:MAG: L-threonylcarbamoyladenylate synthase [Candidatus Paceibacterota bacterium]|jgi:L-threonylcarbamoyladenylate synthase